jgi:dipeptidyl aminopeptidase/acylaminoacyl peptidase
MNKSLRLFCTTALLSAACFAQSTSELAALRVPRSVELSSDGSRLWYKLGEHWWEVETGSNRQPKQATKRELAPLEQPPQVQGTGRLSSPRRSPDRKKVAYLDAERPYGPLLLFCQCGKQEANSKLQPVSRMPVIGFQWAQDSNSFWVIAVDGTDEPVGRLELNGRFEPISQGPAMRRTSGLAAANDVLAWVESNGSHLGTIWVRDRAGRARPLVDPNPIIATWKLGMQEVVRWKSSYGEELQGILAKPAGKGHWPLIVDPYSSWRNRFLNIPVLGNYVFVKGGFAVFFPNHRAPHTFPEMNLGDAYLGTSKDRDPVDVLTDDVMTGIADLVRTGIADPEQLFLYSSSNGATAINQLLTQTRAFRAAVSHGGVSNWLGYYERRRRLGDETIPGFLGGRKPEDSPELYRRIAPVFQAATIATPLLLVIGEKDTRFEDTMQFYEVLRKAGSPVSLVIYPGEGHELSTAALAEQHVQKALEFFRSAAATYPER